MKTFPAPRAGIHIKNLSIPIIRIGFHKLPPLKTLSKFETHCFYQTVFPKGFTIIISCGRSVRAEISAMSIARLVIRPKIILGIKLDKIRIENPIIIVSDV
jgi:hypothetical protein